MSTDLMTPRVSSLLLSTLLFSGLLGVAAGLTATEVNATEVYKWVDAEGNVHFGDQPTDKSEKIIVKDPLTMQFPKAEGEFKANVTERKKEALPLYAISILNPINDSAFQSGSGDIFIEVKTEPALKSDHTLTYRVDGQTVYQGTALTQTVQNLDRGTHSLSVEAQTAEGKVEGQASSTFTLHRPSVLNRPKN